jgi:glycosyltransferase involved in cell wall biosynthesis/SAM-dependent methyltransferase
MNNDLDQIQKKLTKRWDREWLEYFIESNPKVYFTTYKELELVCDIKGKDGIDLYNAHLFRDKRLKSGLGEFNIWLNGDDFTGADLLEIGCGPGFAAKQLGLLAGSYLGLDHSELALSIARLTAPPNCRFLHSSDFEGMKPWVESRDFMVSRHFFIHQNYASAASVLTIAQMLLKPGGVVSADFFMVNPARDPQPVTHPALAKLDQNLPSCAFLFTPGEIEQLANENGFKLEIMIEAPHFERRFIRLKKSSNGLIKGGFSRLAELRLQEQLSEDENRSIATCDPPTIAAERDVPQSQGAWRAGFQDWYPTNVLLKTLALGRKAVRNPRRALAELKRIAGRIIKMWILFIVRFLTPQAFRSYLWAAAILVTGRYAYDARGRIEAQLSTIPVPTRDRPLAIYHGLYHTPQPVFISQEFRNRGLKSVYDSLDRNPNFPEASFHPQMYHPDIYREHTVLRGGYPMRINPPVTNTANLNQLEAFFIERWEQYDVFQFNWFLSFLPDNLDVEFLRRSGRLVYFHFHGCWILEQTINDYAMRGLSAVEACENCRNRQWRDIYFGRFHRGVSQACRVFTSTPNLNHCSPDFEYLPNSLEPGLENALPRAERLGPNKDGTIIVAHAPQSEHVYEKKGTPQVIAAVEQLKSEGLKVELNLIKNMPRHKAIEQYGQADIFVDQLHAGSYGSAAIEAMALGIPVLACNNSVHAHLAPGCPVVHVDSVNITDRLREVSKDAELRKELGLRCHAWRREFHSTKKVADHLLRIYQEDMGLRAPLARNTLSNTSPYYGM